MKSIQSCCLEDSCHVSTTESIGNQSKFVSKIDLLPDWGQEEDLFYSQIWHDFVENSETNSIVENGVNKFIEYLQNLSIETSGILLIGHLNINSSRNKVDMLSYIYIYDIYDNMIWCYHIMYIYHIYDRE